MHYGAALFSVQQPAPGLPAAPCGTGGAVQEYQPVTAECMILYHHPTTRARKANGKIQPVGGKSDSCAEEIKR